jgi:tRNA G10  N-methylase Trm11
VSIEIVNNQKNNSDTELLFKKDLGKTFVLIGDTYARVSVSEVVKAKKKTITDEFKKEFIIPSMKAIYKYDLMIKTIFDLIIKHNSKEIDLLKNGYKKDIIEINNFEENKNEYLELCYSNVGDALIMYDAQNRPFIFIVTSITINKNNKFNIDMEKLNNFLNEKQNYFFKDEVFLMIFQIAYNKLKTTVAT